MGAREWGERLSRRCRRGAWRGALHGVERSGASAAAGRVGHVYRGFVVAGVHDRRVILIGDPGFYINESTTALWLFILSVLVDPLPRRDTPTSGTEVTAARGSWYRSAIDR